MTRNDELLLACGWKHAGLKTAPEIWESPTGWQMSMHPFAQIDDAIRLGESLSGARYTVKGPDRGRHSVYYSCDKGHATAEAFSGAEALSLAIMKAVSNP